MHGRDNLAARRLLWVVKGFSRFDQRCGFWFRLLPSTVLDVGSETLIIPRVVAAVLLLFHTNFISNLRDAAPKVHFPSTVSEI